jgi:hypothetical protein
MYEKTVLRTFVPKREEMVRGRRRLHNEKLHNMLCFTECYFGDQIKEDMSGACSTHERNEKCIEHTGWKT